MGRQVRFVFTDEDIAELELYLIASGAAFIPARTQTPDLQPQADLRSPDGFLGLTPHIIRASDLPNARRRWVATPWAEPPAPGYYGLDRGSVHAIDYMQSGPGCGRLHFDTRVLRNGASHAADPTFVAWAANVLGWIRRTFTYDKANFWYVGPAKVRAKFK